MRALASVALFVASIASAVGATTIGSAPDLTLRADPTLEKAYRRYFEDEKSAQSGERSGETDALLVYRRGVLVYERYGHGFSAERKHRGWSIAKSFTATFLDLLHERSGLALTTPVSECLPGARGTNWEKVSLVDLAGMASGIAWEESYDASPLSTPVTAMLYRVPMMLDMAAYRLHLRRRVAAPGERFNYSTGDTNLLAACLRKYIPNGDWIAFARESLFRPLGIDHFTLELDGARNFVGSSYIYLTARDYLKFGILYLRKGRWAGQSIVSEKWVHDATSPGTPFSTLRLDNDPAGRAYGLGFWLNQPVGPAQIGVAHSSLPPDAFYAKGYEGQYILVIPSEETVVVRLGHDGMGDDRFRLEDFRARGRR